MSADRFRTPYAPPPSLEDVAEGGDYDDLLSDMELDFNVDISDKWPHRRDGDAVHATASEKVDPRDKPGIIGEFNRAFTISQAIERFDLPYRRVK